MPKVKKTRKQSTDSDSDSGPDDKTPVKKQKVDEDAVPEWNLGHKKIIRLSEFKGKWYVNVREFYMDANGDMKPTKKGISLTMEEWQKFKGFVGEIDEAIKKHV